MFLTLRRVSHVLMKTPVSIGYYTFFEKKPLTELPNKDLDGIKYSIYFKTCLVDVLLSVVFVQLF